MGKAWWDERSGSGTGIVTVLRFGGSTVGSHTDSISLCSLFSPIYFLIECGGGIREGRGNLFWGIEAQEYIGSRGLGIFWE